MGGTGTRGARAHQAYRHRGRERSGVLPDFFIGAHAALLEAPLLTRELHRFQSYFPSVRLVLVTGIRLNRDYALATSLARCDNTRLAPYVCCPRGSVRTRKIPWSCTLVIVSYVSPIFWIRAHASGRPTIHRSSVMLRSASRFQKNREIEAGPLD